MRDRSMHQAPGVGTEMGDMKIPSIRGKHASPLHHQVQKRHEPSVGGQEKKTS